MTHWRLISLPLLVAGFTGFGSEAMSQEESLARHGKALVTRDCAGCHAVDRTGDSSHPEAPPFRILGQRYPIEFLAEALGEGLTTGHPDMPEFTFDSEEVGAILAYLRSIQVRKTPQRER